jgi:Raf kinase inhibitor-like YbhB/YbcL family protein
MQLTSPAFEPDGAIPSVFTCAGEEISPPLAWSGLPDQTGSLALRCLDPDAPDGTFTHWLLWDLDPSTGGIGEGRVPPGAREGTNSFGKVGFGGPCPPEGDDAHHYHFELIALRQPLDLEVGAGTEEFDAALRDFRIESCELVGLFARA